MTDKELKAFTAWIEAMIDLKIEQTFGRDYTTEYLRESALRKELYSVMEEKNRDR